ncbi:MAG: DUF928 domain-containing protein [Waterburya sp.]
MNNNHIIMPQLFFASLISIGNILCPDFSRESKFQLPEREIPQRTTPGGSRSNAQCFLNTEQASLTPLIPSSDFGLTLASHPTIFVHIPQTSAQKAFFSIKNLNGDFYYQTTISLPERSAGAVGISLSQAAQPLEIDKNYQWSLVLICGQELEPDDPQVVGTIKRVELDSSLAQSTKLDVSHQSVCLLSQQGIWYDLLHHLAELRKAQPKNPIFAEHWEQLLTKVGLEAIAREPLLY